MKYWNLLAIKKINTAARNQCNHYLKKFDITDAQLDILFYLFEAENEKTNQRDLEKALQLSNPTIVSILNRLEAKELIRRVPSDSDRRMRYIETTEKCKELRSDIYDGMYKNEEQLLTGLSEEDKAELERLLKKLLANATGI